MASLRQPAPPQIVAIYPHTSRLSVKLRHCIGSLQIDINFELTQPWTILFGPSGSGKSTILRAITGLFKPDFAVIFSNPREVSQSKDGLALVDTGKGIWLPPHKRGIALASQKPALFPHMTVLQNILFGYPGVGSPGEKDYLEDLTASIPKLFRIEHLLHRRPNQLSGGEVQRVNLARATMVRGIRILLLDEPFTGLDFPLRDELIADLRVWQDRFKIPILSVTHDVAEAIQLAADVITISDGKMVRQGAASEVLAEEKRRLLDQLNQ